MNYDAFNIIIFVGRCLAGFSGVILLYLVAFAYEDEEGVIQDKFEETWIKISDMETSFDEKAWELLRKAYSILDEYLNNLFGRTFVSRKFIEVSNFLSLGFTAITVSLFALYLFRQKSFLLSFMRDFPMSLFLIPFLFFFIVGISFIKRAIRYRPWKLRYWFYLFILFSYPGFNALISKDFRFAIGAILWLPGLIILSLSSDALFTMATRWIAKISKDTKHSGILILSVLANSLIAVLLSIIPLYLAFNVDWIDEINMKAAFFYLPCANIPSILASSAVIVLCFVIIVGRISWSSISRPLYALQRYRIIEKKKILFFIKGSSLLLTFGAIKGSSLLLTFGAI